MTRQAKLATCFGAVAAVFVVLLVLRMSHLDIDDAVFLTKNSIKELQTLYLCRRRGVGCSTSGQTPNEEVSVRPRAVDLDLDFPFSNVMNSVFPVDLVVSYNVSNSTEHFVARYASFSPVLSGKLTSHFAIVDGYGCNPVNASSHPHYKDKILIVLRGQCTFVRKVETLAGSDLRARAVIVANNEPYHNLITMYLSTFNRDGSLSIPVMFMAYEDYQRLQSLQNSEDDPVLALETASIDNWISLMLLMAVSPPLLIVAFYLAMRAVQFCHHHRVSTQNLRIVRKMAIYIYAVGHLVPAPRFYEYLTQTGQTSSIPPVVSSLESLNHTTTDTEIAEADNDDTDADSQYINGTDLHRLGLSLLFAHQDFYPTRKCAICLERFVPLRLRVLVLECHHVFHETCLLNWLINFRRSCPLCNEPMHRDSLPLLGGVQRNYGAMDLELGPDRADREPTGRDVLDPSATASVRAVHSLRIDLPLMEESTGLGGGCRGGSRDTGGETGDVSGMAGHSGTSAASVLGTSSVLDSYSSASGSLGSLGSLGALAPQTGHSALGGSTTDSASGVPMKYRSGGELHASTSAMSDFSLSPSLSSSFVLAKAGSVHSGNTGSGPGPRELVSEETVDLLGRPPSNSKTSMLRLSGSLTPSVALDYVSTRSYLSDSGKSEQSGQSERTVDFDQYNALARSAARATSSPISGPRNTNTNTVAESGHSAGPSIYSEALFVTTRTHFAGADLESDVSDSTIRVGEQTD